MTSTSRTQFLPGYPTFVNELAGTLAVQSQYVLHGNIRDRYLVEMGEDPRTGEPRPPRPTRMLPLLWEVLPRFGYACLLCYDTLDGVTVYPPTRDAQAAAERVLGKRIVGRRCTLEQLRKHLAKVVGVAEQPPMEDDSGRSGGDDAAAAPDPQRVPVRVAFVIDYAARITKMPGQLDAGERDFFLYAQKLAYTAERLRLDGPAPGALYNPIIWLAEGDRDLPAWFTAGVEPIRTIAVGTPTLGEREEAVPAVARHLGLDAVQAGKFARSTDGMTLHAMNEIAVLARERRIADIGDAVRIYKLGVDDDPWRRGRVRDHIQTAEREIGGVVKGQQPAVTKTLDILKRSALGLSGAQTTSKASRPRGVLFFAGPTGVGKTELAKQVAGALFGDTNAFLRFDMSEFAQEHSADRLAGAPPGYVGFEAGGELTGAVRRDPFRVVLFDEIEKAHDKVLDKFLQILDDGRLTDGQGQTTHFSGCFLIFTSNLGIMEDVPGSMDRKQVVFRKQYAYPDLEKIIKEAIKRYFDEKLGRPELLNRFGDNIVVFDFISDEVADQIFHQQMGNVTRQVQDDLGITLDVDETVRAQLRERCTSDEVLQNGGRGIGSGIESSFVNPLARDLFDRNVGPDTAVTVKTIDWSAAGSPSLGCVSREVSDADVLP